MKVENRISLVQFNANPEWIVFKINNPAIARSLMNFALDNKWEEFVDVSNKIIDMNLNGTLSGSFKLSDQVLGALYSLVYEIHSIIQEIGIENKIVEHA
jgi:hypothetical protein